MKRNIMISTLALVAATGAVASAGSTTIESVRCSMADADDLSATVRYTENASGRRLDYRFSIHDGRYASSSLRDAAGTTVATGSTSSTSRPSVTLGSTWTSSTYANLVDTLGAPYVQQELAACADPATSQPDYAKQPWLWACPIFVFVWDEDLVAQLCGWLGPVE